MKGWQLMGRGMYVLYCVYMLYNRTQAKKKITFLNFEQFSGKGRHSLHYEKP